MLLLKKKSFQLEADSPLVTAEEASAVADAEKVIDAANAEAAAIVEEAKAAYEAEKQRGYEDGMESAKEEMLIQKLDLLDETVNYMEGVEGKVVDLVLKALRKCVAEIGNEELVYQIVRKAMQAIVRTQRQLAIKVAPAMVPVVRKRVNELLAEFPALATIDVQEDSNLSETACIVETEAGLVEASIDGQLKAIRKSIERHFQH